MIVNRMMRFESLIWMVVILFGLPGCLGRGDHPSVEPTLPVLDEDRNVPSIDIRGVQVHNAEILVFNGVTNLSEDNCVYSELFKNEKRVDGWPVGKCFPINGSDLSFSVTMGEEFPADFLDPDAQYRLRVWWSGVSGVAEDEIYFDLSSPPSP